MTTTAEETAANESSPDQDMDEFDAAFDEVDTATAAAPATDPAGDGGNADEDAFPDDDDDAGGSDADTAAAKAGEEEGAKAKDDDPWSAVPESLRGEREQLAQENRALKGRVPGLQRELEELRRFKEQAEAAEAAKADDQEGEDGEDPIAVFKEQYPEIAGPVEALLRNQQKAIDGLKGKVDMHDESFTADRLRAEVELLKSDEGLAKVYAEVNSDGPRNAEFVEWYQAQPREVQAMVERNGEQLVDANLARTVMTLFQAQTAKPDPKGDGDNTQANRRKEALLKGAAGVTGKAPGIGTSIPEKDSFDAAWDFIESQEKAE